MQPNYRKEKPGRPVLWRFLNRSAGYVIKFIQLRYSVNKDSILRSFILRFDASDKVTVLSILEGKEQCARALRILAHLERNCPSILPNLDADFWSVLNYTVRFTPSNYAYLNNAIRRCRQCSA